MKRVLLSTTVLALAVAGVSSASAAPTVYKVTGGGQTLVPTDGGAGDTIAFSAQSQGDETSAAKGQFQYVDRTGDGTGRGQTVVHGSVTCVVVFGGDSSGTAAIGGVTDDGTKYRIDVTDNGSGGGSSDLILIRKGADATGDDDLLCDEDDQPDELPVLNRGNVTIHKAKS